MAASEQSFNPGFRATRLNARTLAVLRQRARLRDVAAPPHVVDASGVRLRRPLQQRGAAGEDEDASASDSDEWESDSDDEPISDKVMCCFCCTPRIFVMILIFSLTLAGWGAAIYFGFIKRETNPRRQPVTWSLWPDKPTDAMQGFGVFDRDGDGYVGLEDIAFAAKVSKGERPSDSQLRKYIAQADKNQDGQLDHDEYLDLLRQEREARAKAGGGGGG